jgi:hypothetical protein
MADGYARERLGERPRCKAMVGGQRCANEKSWETQSGGWYVHRLFFMSCSADLVIAFTSPFSNQDDVLMELSVRRSPSAGPHRSGVTGYFTAEVAE